MQREIVRVSGLVQPDVPQEQLVAELLAAAAELLQSRIEELQQNGPLKENQDVETVIGEPRWDAVTDAQDTPQLRCTVQAHLEY